ncbi:MAG: protein kinase domain-containing protein, partial [Pyrinomonadaceae bacterium]
MIGQTISHYRILSQIGEGGMGVVYAAEDTRLGRRVAVKLPTASSDEKRYRSRFLREARSVSALNHPHIASVYDYGETPEGQPYIVMELVSGRTLSDLLQSSALTLARAVEITEDVAEALAEAHRRGVVHRDIKPSNVLINDRGEVKVLDFGLAKQLNEEHNVASSPDAQTLLDTHTRSDVVIGTPLYLSPEQARGAPVDARSDLFTLGALLYECVAGRPAFSGANVIEIGGQVLHVHPPPPSQFNPRVPPELDRIALKALEKKPENRYQSADEMIADLRAVYAKLSHADTARTRRLVTTAGGRSSALLTLSDTLRRPRLSPAAFLAALVVVLVAVWGYARWRAPTLHKPLPEAVEWYERGTNLLRDGAYDQASRALERAVERDGNFALAHAALAEAWTELDYIDRAREELVRVSALVPDHSVLPQLDALYLNAIRFTALREFGRAAESYAEVARLRPGEPEVYVDLGRAYERTDETQKAVESYLTATDRDPRYATAYLRLGILYGRQSELPSALATFEKADALYREAGNAEGHAEVLFQRGYLFNVTGKFPEARQDLQRALDLARANQNQYQRIQALLALSSVFFTDNRQSSGAEQYAREAVELAQSNGMHNLTARGLVDLGNIFMTRGDYGEAEKHYRQALDFAQRYKARRNEARALLALGSVLIQQIKTDEGIRAVEQALAYYQPGGFRQETV